MKRLFRWFTTDPSARYVEARALPDLRTRVERGIVSLLDSVNPSTTHESES